MVVVGAERGVEVVDPVLGGGAGEQVRLRHGRGGGDPAVGEPREVESVLVGPALLDEMFGAGDHVVDLLVAAGPAQALGELPAVGGRTAVVRPQHDVVLARPEQLVEAERGRVVRHRAAVDRRDHRSGFGVLRVEIRGEVGEPVNRDPVGVLPRDPDAVVRFVDEIGVDFADLREPGLVGFGALLRLQSVAAQRVDVGALGGVVHPEREGVAVLGDGEPRDRAAAPLCDEDALGIVSVGVEADHPGVPLVAEQAHKRVVVEPFGRAAEGDRAVERAGDGVEIAGFHVEHVRFGRFVPVIRVAAGDGDAAAVGRPLGAVHPEARVGHLLVARAVRADGVDVPDVGVVGVLLVLGDEGDPVAVGRPRRLEAAAVALLGVVDGAVEPHRLAAVGVDDEQVGAYLVHPARAVAFVLEAVDLDGTVVVALLEVLLVLLGRVAGGDDESLAVGRPVELADPVVAVGELAGVAAATHVERPDLWLRPVADGAAVRVVVFVLVVPLVGAVLDGDARVGVAGRDEGEAVAVGRPLGAGGAGGAGESVRLGVAVGRRDEQRRVAVVLIAVELADEERHALTVRGDGGAGRDRVVVESLG